MLAEILPLVQPATPELRPYQRDAVDAVLREWQGVRATMIVLATALGKTVIAGEVALRRRAAGRTLWLAHREELLQQARTALERAGLTVEIERAEQHATLLSLMPSDVVVASIQSMGRKRRLDLWRKHPFDTVIVDECHHACSRSYREVLAAFPEAKVLGLTATPDRGDEIAMGTVFDSVAFRKGILEGTRDGWLAPIRPKTLGVEIDMSQVRTRQGDLVAEDLDRELSLTGPQQEVALGLVQWSVGRPTIVFWPGVKAASTFAEVFAAYVGADQVACVHGGQTREQRAEILAGYAEGRIRYVSNCMVLTEGFDAPATSCIAIVRPTKSRALYAQMVGRGTRLSPGKSDCLLLDFCGKTELDLVGPSDVLGGEYELPAEVKRKIKEACAADGEPKTLEEILADAEAGALERERKAQRARLAARLRGIARYVVSDMALVGAGEAHVALVEEMVAASTGRSGDPLKQATDKQRDYLRKYGLALPQTATKWAASKAIDTLRARGVCSLAQARVLSRAGLRTDLSAPEASQAIDALVAAGWQCTPEITARWGKEESHG